MCSLLMLECTGALSARSVGHGQPASQPDNGCLIIMDCSSLLDWPAVYNLSYNISTFYLSFHYLRPSNNVVTSTGSPIKIAQLT